MTKSPLDPNLLRLAYAQGYFPMPDPATEEILWFNPDPRAIIPLDGFHVSRSLRRKLLKADFSITIDQDFQGVMKGCADRKDTWINNDFIAAYAELHIQGDAHSIEVWRNQKLIGGTYGVSLGGAFFAESMFHKETDASKIALYGLIETMKEKKMELLEVQFLTPHLASLGAIKISKHQYLKLLRKALSSGAKFN